MDDITSLATELQKLIQGHEWIGVTSLIVGLLIRLSKTDAAVRWFPVNLPTWSRPVAAIGLGIVGGVLKQVAAGGSWTASIISGLAAAMLAITSHDVVIEGMRGGRELGEKKSSGGGGMGSGSSDDNPMVSGSRPKQTGPYSCQSLVMACMVVSVVGCAAALPVISKVIAAVQDASQILDAIRAAETEFFLIKPMPSQQVLVERALADTALALDVAIRAGQGTKELSAEDADRAFADFRTAFKSLLVLLKDVGVVAPASAGKLAFTRSGVTIEVEPLAMGHFR